MLVTTEIANLELTYHAKELRLQQMLELEKEAVGVVADYARKHSNTTALSEKNKKNSNKKKSTKIFSTEDEEALNLLLTDLTKRVPGVRKAAKLYQLQIHLINAKKERIEKAWPSWFSPSGVPIYVENLQPEPKSWAALRSDHEKHNKHTTVQSSPHLSELYLEAKSIDVKEGGSGVVLDVTKFLRKRGKIK